ncbi:hypothetical protein ABZ484_23245 [Streptomyces sp. NPDC006393]|uniref:hypothetical protein n=1 Tax=Streptomyces sp. NPDC006393 TaxID=3156763 RepID=UPI0033C4CB3C
MPAPAAPPPGPPPRVSRQTSQEVERDVDGLPKLVTSVLVGGKDYYDHRCEARG